MAGLSDYVTVIQAAQNLRLHPETVKRLCRQGDLQATKMHNTWLIHKDTLAAFAQTYHPGRGPGSRFRRIQEEAARYMPRQLGFGTGRHEAQMGGDTMTAHDSPEVVAISDKDFVAEVEAHEFYVSLIMSLTHAFNRVRKCMIENDLSLREELAEYLTSTEIAFIARVVKCCEVEVEGEEAV